MASENKAKVLREAERFVLQGKIAQAIAEYQKVVKGDPGDVLTLNTIGDLYLRQGNVPEATRIFVQVAENYARNNFLLKAIAVYRKILKVDPENPDAQLTLAELFARQGLTADARNQYAVVAQQYAQQGRKRESLEILEKIVEIDPLNAPIHLRLAESYLADGARDKAHHCLVAAARAQVKSGDLQAAVKSYERALELNPEDFAVMKGFLEASMELGDVSKVLEDLRRGLLNSPTDTVLLEMMGRAQMAARDPEGAAKTFVRLVEIDESSYLQLLGVSRMFLDLGRFDDAVNALDPIVPILIGRRETARAVEVYAQVLRSRPDHELSLRKLEAIYSATNDELRLFEVHDRLVEVLLGTGNHSAALEYLEKILQYRPDSEPHQRLHRTSFAEVYPDQPYKSPLEELQARLAARTIESGAGGPSGGAEPSDAGAAQASLVEIDLLITYGMTAKAQAMLETLLARDPEDKEARGRLVSVLRDSGESNRAAEECLLLAACYQKAANQEQADRFLSEARRLAPHLVGPQFDLGAFARKHGLSLPETPLAAASEPRIQAPMPPLEVDLSGDITEIFFGDDTGVGPALQPPAPDEGLEPPTDEMERDMPVRKAPETVQEQLLEVDFYVRLGFLDEARTKLDEIAKAFPGDADVSARYEQLRQPSPSRDARPMVIAPPASTDVEAEPVQTAADADSTGFDLFPEFASEQAGFALADESVLGTSPAEAPAGVEGREAASTVPPGTAPSAPDLSPPDLSSEPPTAARAGVNSMFADLIEEVNALGEQQSWREEYETHFNLGIAYREMGLTDDAVREFEEAVRLLDPRHAPRELIQCCGMLSTCFLQQDRPRSAIRWCQTGLNVSGITPAEAMALRYDMGHAQTLTEEPEKALECFQTIFSVDPTYRDVAHRIDSLRGGSPRSVI